MTLRPKRVAIALLLCGALVVLVAALMMSADQAFAQGGETPTTRNEDGYCLVCHANSQQHVTFPDGSVLSIGIDPKAFAASVHGESNGQGPLSCADCHGEKSYPHESTSAASTREYRVELSLVCTTCHEEQFSELADSVHYEALAEGNFRAATCVDCHGAHEITSLKGNREEEAETCANCHKIVSSEYMNSVHGKALFDGDPNVPGCIDCHGIHGIEHPTTALFRNRSPELCADCHGDKELMKQYGISTNIFESYLSDFHGTTVQLFEQQDPNVPTNKAVCFDCHGVHDIAEVNDGNSRVVRENLLETCQQCHPDATSDFPDSWVGHYEPDLESQPLLYTVNLFYAILIPGVLGGFGVLIATDVYRRLRQRVRRSQSAGDK